MIHTAWLKFLAVFFDAAPVVFAIFTILGMVIALVALGVYGHVLITMWLSDRREAKRMDLYQRERALERAENEVRQLRLSHLRKTDGEAP